MNIFGSPSSIVWARVIGAYALASMAAATVPATSSNQLVIVYER